MCCPTLAIKSRGESHFPSFKINTPCQREPKGFLKYIKYKYLYINDTLLKNHYDNENSYPYGKETGEEKSLVLLLHLPGW